MRIRIVSPAGHTDSDIIDQGAETLRCWGHEVGLAAHAKGEWGRYAGTPEERTADIVDALINPEVDVLWCSRGGYGTMQLLDSLPTDLIARAGKPIVGYSDITALHALWQKAGVASVHGPMMRHLAEAPEHPATAWLRQTIGEIGKLGNWENEKMRDWELRSLHSWISAASHPLDLMADEHPTAPIVGGNLAVLSALHGTPYDFDYQGRILFVEDIGESPYKIDRMMQTLRLAGIFGQLKGLIIGQFTGTRLDEDVTGTTATDATIPAAARPKALLESLHDMLLPYHIPVRFGVPIGHTIDNWPVVEGAPCTL